MALQPSAGNPVTADLSDGEEVNSDAFSPTSTTLLHIPCQSLLGRTLHLTAADKSTKLYSCEIHSLRRPHVIVTSSQTNEVVGRISFHSLTSKIDVTIGNVDILIDSKHRYTSAAMNGAQLRWKGTLNPVLVDEHKTPIAKMSQWALGFKGNKLEISNWWLERWGQSLADEIVVTAFAITEYSRRTSSG